MPEFCERLKIAMAHENVSQSELCQKTKIPKSAMSQYQSGAFKPKQTRTYCIAKALNVNPAWLMGFDAPMKLDDENEEVQEEPTEEDIKVALFGGDEEVTDVMWNDVKKYIEWVKSRDGNK